MKKKIIIVGIALLALSQLQSCRKEKAFQRAKSPQHTTSIQRGGPAGDDEQVLIELGNKLENPYKKSRMLEAWNIAYPGYHVDDLPVTHRQITFVPNSMEQIMAIHDAGIESYNYPFGYEILNDGNYYIQPGKKPYDIPVLYAVVPIDIVLPEGVEYTVEEELCLLPLETRATREAFHLAGVEYKEEIAELLPDAPPVDISQPDLNRAIIDLTRDIIVAQQFTGARPINPYSDGDEGDEGLAASPCGCFSWNNEDKPSGCIKLEDTRWGLQPLAHVRVSFRNIFFSRRAYTNEHGCFQIDHDYWPSAHGFVYFENWLADVRSLDYNLFDTHFDPLGLFNLTGSTHINNLDMIYWRSTDKNSTSSSYYVAATFLNSLNTFTQYCYNDEITPPADGSAQTRLRVLLGKEIGGGSAPMLHKMGVAGYYALLAGLVDPSFSAFVGTLLYPLAMPIYAGIAPDMIIGYTSITWKNESDQLRELYYHELSHVCHFKTCGSPVWARNIEFVVGNSTNDPYGETTLSGTGAQDSDHRRCQLIETWAFFLGRVYTHRTYGKDHHSNVLFGNLCRDSWIGLTAEELTEETYFPYGMLQDLRDEDSDYCSGILESPIVDDDVNHGYTIKEMYDALGTNETMHIWWWNLPNTGQSSTDMYNLFASYPYL
ncbi:MAG TPA: hypothetical protein VD905_13930 [Flavobacteriales bacterium]|nr:hypothetical protein [Flavobacteriales bacterium]